MSPPLPELPLLSPWYRLVEVEDAIVLEHGHRVLKLEGVAVQALLPRLLPLLDGTRPTAEIAAALGAADDAVEEAVRLLVRAGVVVDGPPPDCADEVRATAYLLAAERAVTPAAVAGRLADAAVGVVGSSAAAGETARLLRRSGVARLEARGWDEADRDDDAVVVAPTAGEAASELADWNRRALTARTTWLQLLPFDGCFAAVGPLFVPDETPCRRCYALRRAAALGAGTLFDAVAAVPVAAGGGPALETAAAAVAALHLARWLACRDPALPGVLFALEPRDGVRITAHRVLRVPRCPDCSAAARLAPPLPWFQPAEQVA